HDMLLPPPLPGAVVAADDLLDALEFVRRRFEQWHKEGRVEDGPWQAIAADLAGRRASIQQARQGGQTDFPACLRPADRCWSCDQAFAAVESRCDQCGAPVTAPALKSLRYLAFLEHEVETHLNNRLLPPALANALLAETRQRGAALKTQLEQERLPVV